jgi:hypothetical protein
VGRSPEQLRELQEAFKAVHQIDMLEHIHSFCSDDIIKAFFTEIIKVTLKMPIPTHICKIGALSVLTPTPFPYSGTFLIHRTRRKSPLRMSWPRSKNSTVCCRLTT